MQACSRAGCLTADRSVVVFVMLVPPSKRGADGGCGHVQSVSATEMAGQAKARITY
jgi:hypothetical protein